MLAAIKMEVPPGFGPGNEGFADLYRTTYSSQSKWQTTTYSGVAIRDKAALLRDC